MAPESSPPEFSQRDLWYSGSESVSSNTASTRTADFLSPLARNRELDTFVNIPQNDQDQSDFFTEYNDPGDSGSDIHEPIKNGREHKRFGDREIDPLIHGISLAAVSDMPRANDVVPRPVVANLSEAIKYSAESTQSVIWGPATEQTRYKKHESGCRPSTSLGSFKRDSGDDDSPKGDRHFSWPTTHFSTTKAVPIRLANQEKNVDGNNHHENVVPKDRECKYMSIVAINSHDILCH